MSRIVFVASVLAAVVPLHAPPARAQGLSDGSLDSLVAVARERSPAIAAARARVLASEARVGPAGALPDPVLSVGMMNLPILDPGFGDFMTATVIGVEQHVPFPGKRSVAQRSAEIEVAVAQAELSEAGLEVAASVKVAYYALAHIEQSIAVLTRSRGLLEGLARAEDITYAAGVSAQGDVLDTRAELADLQLEGSRLEEERRTALARLNSLLDRASDTPIEDPRIPEWIAGDAMARIPPLAELQARALGANPLLRTHEREVSMQEARVDVARRAHLPDFDVSLQYSQRVRNADMLSFMVSAPIAIRRSSRQDLEIAGARAEMSALESEHHAMTNEVRAEVAMRHAEANSASIRLELLSVSVGPIATATLDSRIAAYQAGQANFAEVASVLTALNRYDLERHSALVDFATALARLEQAVGAEVGR